MQSMEGQVKTGIASVMVILLAATLLYAGSKEEERLENCATVLEEILNVPDDIPPDLLDKAECVGIIPSLKKLTLFGAGGSYGAGAFVCRSGLRFNGPWGPPAMYKMEGGSFGLQIGSTRTDLVLLVMNPRGVEAILSSKAKLGADAAVAGGPKGRTAAAATDLSLQAEILTYSRSRGLFAGMSLEGATLRPDDGATKEIYGRQLEARKILREGGVPVPAAAKPLVDLLNQRSPRNASE
jgi:lipid-binding SYLF domain-containing protein